MTEVSPRKSDLGVRVISAIVMVTVAGVSLWLGSWVWGAFVALVALGVVWEWFGLVRRFESRPAMLAVWGGASAIYIGLAAMVIAMLRLFPMPAAHLLLLTLLAAVIATDIGAYFVGRSVGGPKIAPAISPSKTWSGLAGGMLGAGIAIVAITYAAEGLADLGWKLVLGGGLAIVAQAGDFFESWMKRRAGAKDSGNLIPGHGGLFDRADGLIAVAFVLGLVNVFRFLLAA